MIFEFIKISINLLSRCETRGRNKGRTVDRFSGLCYREFDSRTTRNRKVISLTKKLTTMFNWIKAHYKARKTTKLLNRVWSLEKDLTKFITNENAAIVCLVLMPVQQSFHKVLAEGKAVLEAAYEIVKKEEDDVQNKE